MTAINPKFRIGRSISAFDVVWMGTLVSIELFLLALYFGASSARLTGLRYVLYPFVWINVGLWVIVKTNPDAADLRTRAIAAGISVGYFLVLALIAGLIGVGPLSNDVVEPGFRIVTGSPGWGPVVSYVGSSFHVTLVPYSTVGYLALSYLVYATVIDAAEAVLSGLVGLFSCVSCTFPVLASLVAGFAGGTTALTTTIYSFSIDLSTLAFLVAIALLAWRPGFGR